MNSVVPLLALLSCAVLPLLSASAQTALVNASDIWRYHKGTNAPQAGWRAIADASLNAEWGSGPGGFGYADGDDATTLGDMEDRYTTVYIRRTFNIPESIDPSLILRLVVDYDDAYVAYLDGQEIGRSANIVNGVAGVEPAFTNRASSTHEAVAGGGPGAVTIALGSAATRLPPGDHLLAILGLNESAGSSDFSLIANLLLVDPNTCPAETICRDTNWVAAASPYVVSGNLTVASGANLTIEPGVTVLFNAGAGLTINGRLIAEGTPANRITFTRSGSSGTWDQLYFGGNSTTSLIAHADMAYFADAACEAHNTALHLDSIWWTNSTAAVVDLHNSSVVLLNSYIPGGGANEPVHFNGMPPNGHALIKGCVFGAPRGYSDSIDFTGGNRPGPIAQFIDNVFLAAVDDCFDMDGTDAHIEGNIFLNVRKDASRSSSSNPITTGADGGNRSELVICRNIFYNGEHVFMQKDHGMGILQNNTILRLTPNPLSDNTDPDGDEAPGIIMFGEPWRGFPFGDGAIFEGNIASDLQVTDPWPLLAQAQAANPNFFFLRDHNCVRGFEPPGAANINADPLFVGVTNLTAANIRQMLALQPGSPCIGTGPNGLDMGALVPSGASLSGAPAGTTTNTSATLKVAGPGIWAYKWRLNGGAWSSEISLVPQSVWNGQPFTAEMFSNTPPIVLTNLMDGTYTVEAIGRNTAGFWQDAGTAVSKTWTVQASPPLFIENVERVGNTLAFTFTAQAGQVYSVLYRDALDAAHPWTKLADIPAQSVTGPFVFTDTLATPSSRFYQVVTPSLP
jgi:hypothetical protein